MTEDRDQPRRSDTERTFRLSVPSTGCRDENRRVIDDLLRVDGVLDATSQPRSGTAFVTYDPSRTSEEAIAAAAERPQSNDVRKSARGTRRNRSGCCCGGPGR